MQLEKRGALLKVMEKDREYVKGRRINLEKRKRQYIEIGKKSDGQKGGYFKGDGREGGREGGRGER